MSAPQLIRQQVKALKPDKYTQHLSDSLQTESIKTRKILEKIEGKQNNSNAVCVACTHRKKEYMLSIRKAKIRQKKRQRNDKHVMCDKI